MDLLVSRANSIHFIKNDGLFPTPEVNRLSGNEKYGGGITIFSYCQKFDHNDIQKVQCVSSTNTLPTIKVIQEDGTTSSITPTLVASVEPSWVDPSLYRYNFEFNVDYSLYAKKFKIFATKGADPWESEWQKAEDMNLETNAGRFNKIGYTNEGQPVDFPNFQINYTTGIQFCFYIEALTKDPKNESSEETFTNQNRKELTEYQLFTGSVLKTAPIPRFLATKLAIAAGSFVFTVNDTEYIADGGVDNESFGQSNFVTSTVDILDKEALALHSDDRGIQTVINEGVQLADLRDLRSTGSVVHPKGYMLHVIFAAHEDDSAAGSYQFKASYTPGGDDIVIPGITNVANNNITRSFGEHIDESMVAEVDKTLYFEIVNSPGAKAFIRVNFLKNS